MLSKSNKQIVLWLFGGCFLVFAMVVVGGITRLTHSGLSITEWNVLMGSIPPLNERDWQIAFEKYRQFPEFQKVNFDMGLSEFKSIFWWEFMHRLIGRLIGIVFIVPFLYFLLKGKLSRPLAWKLAGVFVLGGFQGFLGWFMVASGLVDNPHVSHYRLAAHLITAFLTFAYILWLALDILYPAKGGANTPQRIGRLSSLILITVIVQIIYGAFVAGLKAGLIYNTFPKMGDSWIPDAVTAMEPGWKNVLENMAGVQFVHRCIAWLLVILVSILVYVSRKDKLSGTQKNGVNLLAGMLVVQFTLGVLTVMNAVPLLLGALHQMGAFFLFTTALFFHHQTRNKSLAARY